MWWSGATSEFLVSCTKAPVVLSINNSMEKHFARYLTSQSPLPYRFWFISQREDDVLSSGSCKAKSEHCIHEHYWISVKSNSKKQTGKTEPITLSMQMQPWFFRSTRIFNWTESMQKVLWKQNFPAFDVFWMRNANSKSNSRGMLCAVCCL